MANKKPTQKVNEDTKTAEAEAKAKVEKEAAEAEAQAKAEKDAAEAEAKAKAEKDAAEAEAQAKADKEAAEAEAKAKAEKDAAEVEANAQIEQDRNKSADDSDVAEQTIETRTKNGAESHWRGGKEHTKEKQSWPAGTFTAGQIAKIKNDPHLTVKVLSD